jgi:3-keto-disaccharide hydrolase
MRKTLVLMLGLSAMAAYAEPTAAAETVALSSDWNSVGEQPDRCASGLTGGGAPPKWVIVKTEPGKLGVAETSTDRTDYRFPLCIVDGAPYAALADVDVSVRFRPMMGKVDQAGGIAIRVKDPQNYYVVRANALEDNVRLYAVIDGDRKQFAGANLKVAPQQWHTLRIKAVGDRFTVFFDGKQLYEATDKRITAPGRVALWSKADSVTQFVDLSIEPLP